MIRNYQFLFIAICIFSGSIATAQINNHKNDSLGSGELKPYGRTLIDKDYGLELISSAAHFSFSFEGTGCEVFTSIPATMNHNYLQYELDGVYQKRLRVSDSNRKPIMIQATKAGKHRVSIYKATEAQTGPIFIQRVSGKNIAAIPDPLAAPVIEFIGNSITCGAAADASEIPCGVGEYHDHHNAYYAYGPRVARALHANYIVSSVSGIGVYRNWNSDGPAMPQVYEKAQLRENGLPLWDFKTYSPDIISIALGTNDLSRGDGIKKGSLLTALFL